MSTVTNENLSDKLKNAPQNILERVAGYVDALVADEVDNFELSEDQKRILDNQDGLKPSVYSDAKSLFEKLKTKYELQG